MDKININASQAQSMTAEEINALAQHILNRKGDVDMSSCSCTITPPSGMDADNAGVISKCASSQNGIVNINGATSIEDDVWEILKEHSAPLWMYNASQKSNTADIDMIAKVYYKYPSSREAVEAYPSMIPFVNNGKVLEGFPKIYGSGTTAETTWLFHSCTTDYESTWQSEINKIIEETNGSEVVMNNPTIGSGSDFLIRAFIPTTMPTGITWVADDEIYLCINGQYIGQWGYNTGNSSGSATIDFSNIIKLNSLNVAVIRFYQSVGGSSCRFGFTS